MGKRSRGGVKGKKKRRSGGSSGSKTANDDAKLIAHLMEGIDINAPPAFDIGTRVTCPYLHVQYRVLLLHIVYVWMIFQDFALLCISCVQLLLWLSLLTQFCIIIPFFMPHINIHTPHTHNIMVHTGLNCGRGRTKINRGRRGETNRRFTRPTR